MLQANSYMHCAIIIINYRTPELVINCLNSLEDQIEHERWRVTVVDNCSQDNSLSLLKEAIDEKGWTWVEIITTPYNGGFAYGNNFGIRYITADYYLLLNSDTIVRPYAIKLLLDAMQKYPKAGIVSPRLEWPDGTPQISCFRFHSPISELIASAGTGFITSLFNKYTIPLPLPEQPITPEWTSFACVLIRKEIFEEVGMLDEGYFMYFEDVDFCRRVTAKGWTILHCPSARVVHLRGYSSELKTQQREKKRLPAYYYQSRSRYYQQFFGKPGWLVANLCWMAGRSISKLREVFTRKDRTVVLHATRDIWIK